MLNIIFRIWYKTLVSFCIPHFYRDFFIKFPPDFYRQISMKLTGRIRNIIFRYKKKRERLIQTSLRFIPAKILFDGGVLIQILLIIRGIKLLERFYRIFLQRH